MYLETRKIEFIQEFLKLQGEEVMSRLEKILEKVVINSTAEEFAPMTIKEKNRRIDISESDFHNNRVKSTSELLAKYEKLY